ncbi:MAG: sodium-dependent bicarbonate transport family permease [Parvularculaceae bacterium]|nr:sodium-dependent bicarbonate transport family permease [Parvularculaceae bacterium]
MALDLALSTLLSPVVLFFVLGLLAALARSELTFPEAISKGLAIYLMMAIGLKGGFEMAKSGLTPDIIRLMIAGVALSFTIPVIAFAALRATTRLDPVDAAATAAHYGSISIVTFVAATQAVEFAGLKSGGHMVAVAALMETPAIMTALLLASRGATKSATATRPGELLREVALNASVVVLVGALLIGWITGEAGEKRVGGVFITPLQGVLCLFLLDMGLAAGRGLRNGWRTLSAATIAFGVYMPLVSAALAAAAAYLLGLSAANAAIFITLAASASYIAVPAAMRLALPKARPAVYLTLSLGVTFPFNLTFGIPLYIYVAELVAR